MLESLAPGVFAWLDHRAGRGHTNAGVVVEDDGVTLIDALMVPAQFEPFAAAVEALGRPVRRLVLSSSHIPYAGGSGRFKLAAVYGSARASADLDQPPNPHGYARLYPEFAGDFAEVATRPVTHVVAEPVWLTPAVIALPLGGQIAQNLVVQVPGANIVFGGALCVFGATPLAFDGDPAAWAESLGRIGELGDTVVPGQGPVGGATELATQQAYLSACVEAAGRVPIAGGERFAAWPDREFDEINVERAAMLARGDTTPPPSILRVFELG